MIGSESRQYIIELDKEIYSYKNGCLDRISKVEEVDGEAWLITDFASSETPNSISRVTIVDTKAQYAPIMIAKQLQEEGEFAEPIQVITHVMKKAGAERTAAFYTALPITLFQHYQERIAQSQNLRLLFPMYTVLLQVIRTMAGKQPLALIFRHNNHADLLIANNSKVYYANRATIYDNSEDEAQVLWGIVHNDITTAEREQHIRVEKCVVCNWFDALDQPDWGEETGRIVEEAPVTLITVDGESKPCSLLPLLEGLRASDSISSAIGIAISYSRQFLPVAQIIILIMALGLLAGGNFLRTRTVHLKQEISADKQKLGSLTDFTLRAGGEYRPALTLLKQLDTLRQSKSFKTVIGDLSAASSRHMTMDQIKAEVQQKVMKIEIHGIIAVDFQTAYREYQGLINRLKKNKYTIVDSTFTTEIDKAQFLLTCTSPMGELK